MQFIYNDGGREAAGYKGSAGDCVTRAIAIVTRQPYQTVYDALHERIKVFASSSRSKAARRAGRGNGARGSTPRNGVCRQVYESYLKSLGYKFVATMGIGTGCRVHLTDGELPMGRLIVRVSKHLTAIIDGVIHDTFSPERELTTFRKFPGWDTVELKPGEQRNINGIFTTAKRCVYGFYIKVD